MLYDGVTKEENNVSDAIIAVFSSQTMHHNNEFRIAMYGLSNGL
jgi:hypothetical protein